MLIQIENLLEHMEDTARISNDGAKLPESDFIIKLRTDLTVARCERDRKRLEMIASYQSTFTGASWQQVYQRYASMVLHVASECDYLLKSETSRIELNNRIRDAIRSGNTDLIIAQSRAMHESQAEYDFRLLNAVSLNQAIKEAAISAYENEAEINSIPYMISKKEYDEATRACLCAEAVYNAEKEHLIETLRK